MRRWRIDRCDRLLRRFEQRFDAAQRPAGPSPSESRVETLLESAQQAIASVDPPAAHSSSTVSSAAATTSMPAGVRPFEFRSLAGKSASSEAASIDLLRDVQLDLKIELGRTRMQLEEVLQLKRGAVVTLDKLAGDPVDIFVNGRLIARGEVLVLNDNFCVRVAELVAGESSID
jgi:flagellar motor switch protein FliN/FliY